MEIQKKMMSIRNSLKLTKNAYNQQGGFAYRNAESMAALIKPACASVGLTYWFEDDIISVERQIYLKTTLVIFDTEDSETFEIPAFAREPEPGVMVGPQRTGSASSYAHKYALQNAFAVDDGSADPDSWGDEDASANYGDAPQYEGTGETIPSGNTPPVDRQNTYNMVGTIYQPQVPYQPQMPYQPYPAPASPAPAPQVQSMQYTKPAVPVSRRLQVFGVRFDKKTGISIVGTPEGEISYDARTATWHSQTVDISKVDLNALYRDASTIARRDLAAPDTKS